MADTKVRISKRTVDALEAQEKRYRAMDTDLSGFGVRITPAGVKTYFVRYRPAGAGRSAVMKDYTIGKHGVVTPDQARAIAKDVLAAVHDGQDPQSTRAVSRTEPTIDAFCDLYLAEGYEHKAASTRRADLSRINAHIRPLLGHYRLSEVTSAMVEQFKRDVAAGKSSRVREANRPRSERRGGTGPGRGLNVKGGKGAATRTVGLLGGMFTFALSHPQTSAFVKVNPVSGVERYKDRRMERFLSADELSRLGAAIRDSKGNERAIKIVLLLALTGARKGEIEGLPVAAYFRHLKQLQLGDSKTGFKYIPLNDVACSILDSVELVPGSPYFFPATRAGERPAALTPFSGTRRIWGQITAAAGLENVRLHDLRHTFASTSLNAGKSLQAIGKILGHKDIRTTQQYAHLADPTVRDAVASAGEITADALGVAVAPLTAEQSEIVEKMVSIGMPPEAIARALEVSVTRVLAAMDASGRA